MEQNRTEISDYVSRQEHVEKVSQLELEIVDLHAILAEHCAETVDAARFKELAKSEFSSRQKIIRMGDYITELESKLHRTICDFNELGTLYETIERENIELKATDKK